MKRKDL